MDPMLLSAGLQGVGNLFSGIMGFFSGNAQADAEKQAARQALAESSIQGQEAIEGGAQTAARAAVGAAANGGGLVGSSLGIVRQLGDQAMFNARARIYTGQTQARNDMYAANVAKMNATNSLIGGGVGAASSAAGGWAANMYDNQYMSRLGQLRHDGADSPYDYSGATY